MFSSAGDRGVDDRNVEFGKCKLAADTREAIRRAFPY